MNRVYLAIIEMPDGTLSVRSDMSPRQAVAEPHTRLSPAQVLARRMLVNAYYPKHHAAVHHGATGVPLVALALELLESTEPPPLDELKARLRTCLGMCPVQAAAAGGK